MLLHPLMLAWLAGAAVPLVVHLLSRSRYRAVEWGAMMFLTGPDGPTRHFMRARQWTLLAIRMSMVGLLAIALARPVISARHANVPAAGLVTGSTAAVVIVLDDSPAMGYVSGDKSRMDLARQVTLQLLSTLKRGDQAALLLAGNRDYPLPTALSPDIQSIASKVSDLQPDIYQPDMAIDIVRAADLLDHAGPVDREIYIITDRQAMPWRSVLADTFTARWQARKAAGPLPRVTLLPVGGDEADNLAVEAIEFPDRPVIQGRPTTVQVRVRNYGPSAATEVPLLIWTGISETIHTTITVPAHSTRSAAVPWRFDDVGSHVISAAVRSTGLTSDDRLDVALDVLSQLRVLIVDNPSAPAATIPSTQAATRPVGILDAALLASNRPGEPLFAVTDAAPSELNAQLLKKSDVLILNDIGRLAPNQLKAVQLFVDGGGGVLILPGGDTRAAVLNATLRGSNANLLPVVLKTIAVKPTHVASFDRQHPIFHFLTGSADPFAAMGFNRYFPSTPNPTGTHIIAKFASGDPFIVDSTIGRGKVLMLTTGLGREWNSILQSPVFRPLITSMVHFLGAGAPVDRNAWPGQMITISSDEPVQGSTATLQSLTSAMHESIPVTRNGDRNEIHFGRPGTYRVRFKSGGAEKSVDLVVSAGHACSDLTPLNQAQWKTLLDRANFERVDLSQTGVATAIESRRGGREVWIDLLAGVLVLMLAETFLSRWWT